MISDEVELYIKIVEVDEIYIVDNFLFKFM
jgi:hypothetical protein